MKLAWQWLRQLKVRILRSNCVAEWYFSTIRATPVFCNQCKHRLMPIVSNSVLESDIARCNVKYQNHSSRTRRECKMPCWMGNKCGNCMEYEPATSEVEL